MTRFTGAFLGRMLSPIGERCQGGDASNDALFD
jgi:hypothetical protein